VIIDFLKPDQNTSMTALLNELHAHYNGAKLDPSLITRHLEDNLLSPESVLKIVVASDSGGEVVGLLAFTFLNSLVDPAPEKRLQCMIKELFVKESFRSAGTGRDLMNWVIAHAKTAGCARMDWHVKATNEAGIRFYRSFGAAPVADRASFRLMLR
jgi:GNAT superfamily N-acetyltransferase